MSVPVRDRKENKFDVINAAYGLAVYTITICCNENVFLPKYQSAVTDDLIRDAKDIYRCCWTANGIRLDSRRAGERDSLQNRAGMLCNDMLATIQLSQRIFHLSVKRVKYWGDLVIRTRELIRGWKDSDRIYLAKKGKSPQNDGM